MYNPDEACLHQNSAHIHHGHLLSPDASQQVPGVGGGYLGERPTSFASVDSSTTSDSLSPSGSSNVLFARSLSNPASMRISRYSSTHATTDEVLDYRTDRQFLDAPSSDTLGSTPEVGVIFELWVWSSSCHILYLCRVMCCE